MISQTFFKVKQYFLITYSSINFACVCVYRIGRLARELSVVFGVRILPDAIALASNKSPGEDMNPSRFPCPN